MLIFKSLYGRQRTTTSLHFEARHDGRPPETFDWTRRACMAQRLSLAVELVEVFVVRQDGLSSLLGGQTATILRSGSSGRLGVGAQLHT